VGLGVGEGLIVFVAVGTRLAVAVGSGIAVLVGVGAAWDVEQARETRMITKIIDTKGS
jgi:hypothetical protein